MSYDHSRGLWHGGNGVFSSYGDAYQSQQKWEQNHTYINGLNAAAGPSAPLLSSYNHFGNPNIYTSAPEHATTYCECDTPNLTFRNALIVHLLGYCFYIPWLFGGCFITKRAPRAARFIGYLSLLHALLAASALLVSYAVWAVKGLEEGVGTPGFPWQVAIVVVFVGGLGVSLVSAYAFVIHGMYRLRKEE